MTNQHHPITPPPELYKQWEGMTQSIAFEAAYRAGADEELEACCEWLANARNHTLTWNEATNYSANLLHARRPKPPSLKEEALAVLDHTQKGYGLAEVDLDTIRRALESLPD